MKTHPLLDGRLLWGGAKGKARRPSMARGMGKKKKSTHATVKKGAYKLRAKNKRVALQAGEKRGVSLAVTNPSPNPRQNHQW